MAHRYGQQVGTDGLPRPVMYFDRHLDIARKYIASSDATSALANLRVASEYYGKFLAFVEASEADGVVDTGWLEAEAERAGERLLAVESEFTREFLYRADRPAPERGWLSRMFGRVR